MASKKSRKRTSLEEIFEIDRILDHQQKSRCVSGALKYAIKWRGYPDSFNSIEDSWQFKTFRDALEYWNGLSMIGSVDSTPVRDIAQWHRLLHEWQKERFFLRSDDWFSINSVDHWIVKYDWSWQLQDFTPSTQFPTNEALFLHYESQLKNIAMLYENVPFIEVVNEFDDALPIPWKHLLFGIEYGNPKTNAVKDTVDAFGLVLSFNGLSDELSLQRELLGQQGRLHSRKNSKVHGKNDGSDKMKKWPFPWSKVSLKLERSCEFLWELRHMHERVEKNEVIMPLTGEIAPVSVADDCMLDEGKFVAMSSFVQITKDFCLDRRFFSGFDRFIHHSCNPNCYVEVALWNKKPVAMVKAKRTILKEEALTMDYFLGVKIPDSANPSKFYAERTEHIYCVCSAPKCREYLWIEERKKGKGTNQSRLIQSKVPFHGLPVVKILPRQKQKNRIIVDDDSDED